MEKQEASGLRKHTSGSLRWSLIFGLLIVYLGYSGVQIQKQTIWADTRAKPSAMPTPDHRRIARLLEGHSHIVLYNEDQSFNRQKMYYEAQFEFFPAAVIPRSENSSPTALAVFLTHNVPIVLDRVSSARRKFLQTELRKKAAFTTMSFGDRFLVLQPSEKQ